MCHNTTCEEGTPGLTHLSDTKPCPTASEQLTETGHKTHGYILTEVSFRQLSIIWTSVAYVLTQEKWKDSHKRMAQ